MENYTIQMENVEYKKENSKINVNYAIQMKQKQYKMENGEI